MGLRYRNSLTDCSHFFVTTTVVKFLNVFKDCTVCDLLIHNIKHYQKRYEFNILAYVIMPSHFHWIIEVNKRKGTVSDIMRDIKKYSAWDIMEYLEKENSNYSPVFSSLAKDYEDQRRKFWMPRFYDEVMRNEKMFWQKLHYIHYNPVNAGIVDNPAEYKYSIEGDHSLITVDTSLAGTQII